MPRRKAARNHRAAPPVRAQPSNLEESKIKKNLYKNIIQLNLGRARTRA